MREFTTFVKPEELQRIGLFAGVNLDTISKQLSTCTVRELEAGETLIARGQTNNYMYLLIAGRLRIFLDTMGEALSILEAGESVGEISIIDKLPTSAHVVAETRCRLFVINEQTLWSMVSDSHAVAVNMLSLLASRLRDANAKLSESQERQRRLEYEASIDPLTGLYNKHWLDRELEGKLAHARNVGQYMSLLMLDIDHFQDYNDRNGHLAGDRALHELAQALLNNLRPMDTAVRFGSALFLVILPDTNPDTATQVAEDIRIIAQGMNIRTPDGKTFPPITVSIGISTQHDNDTPEALVNRADKARAVAKKAGRNCVSNAETSA
jgi:diguanylate cyclase (GGDEF)-like protein